MVRRLEDITGEEMLRELDLFCLEKRRPRGWGWGNLIAVSSHLSGAYGEDRVEIFFQLQNDRMSDNSCKLQQGKL